MIVFLKPFWAAAATKVGGWIGGGGIPVLKVVNAPNGWAPVWILPGEGSPTTSYVDPLSTWEEEKLPDGPGKMVVSLCSLTLLK